MAGQAAAYDELRARRCLWPPLRLTRVCREHVSVSVASPATSLVGVLRAWRRGAGCVSSGSTCTAISARCACLRKVVRCSVDASRPGRPSWRRSRASLDGDDLVALETSGPATAVARVLERHAGRVVVVDPRGLVRAGSRAKTDRLDARTLARLLAAGVLIEIWTPDEATRALRRLVARRAAVVRARTRLKNEVHAVLARNLCPRPPVTDAFGKAGRRWLGALEMPEEEQLTLRGCLRQIDALDADVGELEVALAKRLSGSRELRRLLSVPGVNLVVGATFLAYIGEISRFPSRGSWSATLASTRASASPATRRRAAGGSPSRVRLRSATSSPRRPGAAPAFPARCAGSTSASARGAARRSRSPPPHASSPCSSGICSPASRTTPSQCPRPCSARGEHLSCSPAHPLTTAARHRRARADLPPPSEQGSATSRSRPNRPINACSPTGTPNPGAPPALDISSVVGVADRADRGSTWWSASVCV